MPEASSQSSVLSGLQPKAQGLPKLTLEDALQMQEMLIAGYCSPEFQACVCNLLLALLKRDPGTVVTVVL